MKIGVLGGTFDPPHMGHILLALNSKKECGLDKIIILPSANPPHKKSDTNSEHRLNLAKLIAQNYGFELCDYEYKKQTPSYTVETIDYFNEIYPNDEIYFIIGGDSMLDFEKWHKWQELIVKCNFIVGIRDEESREEVLKIADEKIKKYGANITVLKNPAHKVSSSDIRKGNNIYEIPECVAEYIKENSLYKENKI